MRSILYVFIYFQRNVVTSEENVQENVGESSDGGSDVGEVTETLG